MNLTTHIRDCGDYNFWANQKMAHWLSEKPSELMNREIPSSYPTLKRTVLHLWDSERFWLSFITEQESLGFRRDFEGSIDDLFQGFVNNSKVLQEYIHSVGEAELLKPMAIHTPWLQATKARYSYIHHCLNHSTYHRGQLVTMARGLGITDPPNTDYNFFR